jgi:hypothetical protein
MRLSLAILKGLPAAFLLLLAWSSNVCAESGDWVQFYRPAQEDIKKSRWVEAEHNLKQAMPLAKELGEDEYATRLPLVPSAEFTSVKTNTPKPNRSSPGR